MARCALVGRCTVGRVLRHVSPDVWRMSKGGSANLGPSTLSVANVRYSSSWQPRADEDTRAEAMEKASLFSEVNEHWTLDSLDKSRNLREFVLMKNARDQARRHVFVTTDVSKLRQEMEACGWWNPKMAAYCGMRGFAIHLNDHDRSALIRFEDGQMWWLGQDALDFREE
eukprot:TRINITY_DN922_c0_g1_i3.p1 TRINITY_DN922_c0_g1~~TRINITY_DN922_c0_g1_i3.p1  ORF type:complete len:170 (-),score=15.46 TRINITY_DN922_c0_g1_i3:216-725(-)